MKKLWKALCLSSVAVLAACGGGGGSGGESSLQYRITLTAAKSQLPLNISQAGAGQGAYAPFTTTMYVEARSGASLIPGGENIFSCNIAAGLDSGSLYYLDGSEEHEDDNGVPLAYRSITLGANSGGATFHFHAKDQAGTSRVTCSVTDPRDNKVYSASTDIVVGAATGKPSSVIGVWEAPQYLGSRDNTATNPILRNNIGINAFIMDDANQPIPNPSAPNLQVSIRPVGAAAVGARLVSGNQSGSVLQLRTIGGVSLASLSSGPSAGSILLEYVTDRFDNDISNGIQDPVIALQAVPVVHALAAAPLSLAGVTAQSLTIGVPFAAVFAADGGVPPYKWTALNLPGGLSMSSDGIVSGAPQGPKGEYSAVLTVVDSLGAKASANVAFTVAESDAATVPNPLTVNGCVSNGTAVCALPRGTSGQPYLFNLSATGGNASEPVAWTYAPTPLPAGLQGGSTGNSGVISSTNITGSNCNAKFLVTATRGTVTVTQQVSVQIGEGDASCK